MPVLEIRQKPQGKVLSDYFNSWGRVELIMGPLGSAKTVTSCQKIMQAMISQEPNNQGIRPTRFYAIRNTYSDLLTTTVKDWLELYSELGAYVEGNKKPPTHSLDFDLQDGTTVNSEMIFIALDRSDSIKKLRGSQVTGFWLNEVKELHKSVVDMADLRHGRYPSKASGGVSPTWHGMIGDTNAPDEDHWYYDLAENVKPKDWTFHRQPGGLLQKEDSFESNPLAENVNNLPEGYYIRGMQGKSKDWVKINLCNEYGFVMDGKPVYPEYVDSIHCLSDDYVPSREWPIILGADFGRTPACALLQFNPFMGRYIGFDEFVTHDMSAALFAPELKLYLDREYPGFKFNLGWADPSGSQRGQATEDTPLKILGAHGLAFKGTSSNDPLIRRAAIVNPMTRLCIDGKPAFMISPKCKVWRKGLAGGFCFKRKQVAGERYHDEPDKNEYSHICEAGEYALQGSGEGAKAIRPANVQNQPIMAQHSFEVF